jgi:hypothetical protein
MGVGNIPAHVSAESPSNIFSRHICSFGTLGQLLKIPPLDLSAAFEVVDHLVLLDKLRFMGLRIKKLHECIHT